MSRQLIITLFLFIGNFTSYASERERYVIESCIAFNLMNLIDEAENSDIHLDSILNTYVKLQLFNFWNLDKKTNLNIDLNCHSDLALLFVLKYSGEKWQNYCKSPLLINPDENSLFEMEVKYKNGITIKNKAQYDKLCKEYTEYFIKLRPYVEREICLEKVITLQSNDFLLALWLPQVIEAIDSPNTHLKIMDIIDKMRFRDRFFYKPHLKNNFDSPYNMEKILDKNYSKYMKKYLNKNK